MIEHKFKTGDVVVVLYFKYTAYRGLKSLVNSNECYRYYYEDVEGEPKFITKLSVLESGILKELVC